MKKNFPDKDKHAAKRKKDKANAKCFHCGKKGHFIEECRKRKADKAEANKKKGKGIQNLDEKEKTEKDDKEESSDEEVGYLGQNFLGVTRGAMLH